MLEKENSKTHPALDSVPLVHLFFLVIYKSICLFINGKLWDEWKTAQQRRAIQFISFFFQTEVLKRSLSKQTMLTTSQSRCVVLWHKTACETFFWHMFNF